MFLNLLGSCFRRYQTLVVSAAVLALTGCNPFLLQFDDHSRDSVASTQIGSLQSGKVGHHIEVSSGNLQNGYTKVPLRVPVVPRIVDAFGFGVPNITLNISVKNGGGSVVSNTGITNANGEVAVIWTMGNAPGPNALTIYSVDPLVGLPISVQFDATATVDPTLLPTAIAVAGNSNNQSGAHNTYLASPLQVFVTNASGVGVPGIQIDWTVTSGTANVSAPATSTVVGGTTSNALLLHAVGAQTITATVHDYPSLSITFSAASISTGFNQVWNFLSTASSSFILGANVRLNASNACELTTAIQTDAASSDYASGSSSGILFGTLIDGTSTGLKLGSGGTCDGSAVNCSEMDSSWAPQWTSLTAYWKLNNSFVSEKGAFTGTSIGSAGFSTTNRKMGNYSLAVDGSTQYVSTPVVSVAVNNFTMSAWFRSNNVTQAGQMIFYNGSELVSGGGGYGFGLNKESVTSGHIYLLYGNIAWTDTNYVLPDTNWHHGVMTVTTTGLRTMYIDGAQIYSDSPSAPQVPNTSTFIGSDDWSNTANTRHFNGNIDEVAYWNTALTSTEVRQIYSRQSAIKAGTFTSRVFDAYKTTQSWKTLYWNAGYPFGKPLPDPVSGAVQNETSVSYTGLASTSLMTGIVGLWHLDEASGTSGSASVKDTSATGANGTPTNITFGGKGQFGNSASFAGNGSIAVGVPAAFPSGTSARTLCGWAKPSTVAGGYRWIFAYGTASNSQAMFLGMNGATLVTGGYGNDHQINNIWQAGVWSHVCLTYNGTTATTYFNGVQVAQDGRTWNLVKTAGAFGQQVAGGENWQGAIDEVALWARSLSATEVMDLYHRGVSRLKFQVRSCATSDCSGVTETWQGLDGTSSTYYTERDNSTSGLVNSAAPTLTFAASATPTPIPNRYFQYRTTLESDVTTANLQPELRSVQIGPTHYDTTNPTVIGKTGVTYYSLSALSQVPVSPTCAGGVTYNLGVGSDPAYASWYWWDSTKAANCSSAGTGAWCLSNGSTAQSNSATVVTTNATAFPLSLGMTYFKAFLNSNGETSCSLNSVELDGQL